MESKVIAEDAARIKTDAIIVTLFEEMKPLGGDSAAIDKALAGAISQLITQGEIKGKLNEVTLIHTLGKLPAARVAVVGLGKKQELSQGKIRGAVAETCRLLRQKGVKDIATTAQGAGIGGISLVKFRI